MSEYNFDFEGYQPTWLEYADASIRFRDHLSAVAGETFGDIKGVVSQDGWEPDWPVVFEFPTAVFAINTKQDHLWAIDRWHDFRLRVQDEGEPLVLTYESIADIVDLTDAIGKQLEAIAWPRDRSDWSQQAFLFRFVGANLRVFDAGDELGLEVLDEIEDADWENIY